MKRAPFDVPRSLRVPEGISASVYARVDGARFMAFSPDGRLFVSKPGDGEIVVLRPRTGGDAAEPEVFASGLRRPHDMVFHRIGDTDYLYVSETHRVTRSRYSAGDRRRAAATVLVDGLPDSSTPELKGAYGHELKNIAVDRSHRLYVSIASTCNACLEDTKSDPVRGSVYRYGPDGGKGALFARGLRNAEGLAFVPGTDLLWVTVNNRDQIPYPFKDSTGNYGKIVTSYVDDHPPEEFTSVREGADYGWPFANPNPDTSAGMNRMPFDPDVDFNADLSRPLASFTRIDKGIQAHSAPLGFIFTHDTKLPAPFRDGALLAYHGSWNRSRKTGYRVAYFPWSTSGLPGDEADVISGWLDDDARSAWGRPVDVAAGPDGSLFVSDDGSGTIYRFTPRAGGAAEPRPRIARILAYDAGTRRPLSWLRPGVTLGPPASGGGGLLLRAFTKPRTVGSVRFRVGTSLRGVDASPPYLLNTRDGAGRTRPWRPAAGRSTVRAAAYTGPAGTGVKGPTYAVSVTIGRAG